MLSDTDINEKLGTQDIKITDYDSKFLTPVGYDLRVGVKGFSWKKLQTFSISSSEPLKIAPHDTIVVETLESIELSKKIGGTIHATATDTLRRGLSHISTTVDPGWRGKLLISLHNNLDIPVEFEFQQVFCTVCFYQMQTEANVAVLRPIDRTDIWDTLLTIAREEKARLQVQEEQEKARLQAQEEARRKEEEVKRKEQVNRARLNIIYRVVIFSIILISGVIATFSSEPGQAAIVIAALAAGVTLLPDVFKT